MTATRPQRIIFLLSDIFILNVSFLITAYIYVFCMRYTQGTMREVLELMFDANRILTIPWVVIFLIFGFYKTTWRLSLASVLLAVAAGIGLLFLATLPSGDIFHTAAGRILLLIYATAIFVFIYMSRFLITALFDRIEGRRGHVSTQSTITGAGYTEREFGISTDFTLVHHTIGYIALKRLMDLALGMLAFLAFLPTIIILACIIKITDPRGPVFFRQYRLGKNGRVFRIFKFRTMVHNAEDILKQDRKLYEEYIRNNFKLPPASDIRITRIGSFLRKTSLDEVPQIFNVLAGDMSLVGPRPIVVDELVKYDKYRKKLLSVKPGVMGWWQVAGRSNIDYPDRIYLEMFYIEKASIFFDLKILIETIPTVLFTKGAH